MATLAERQLTHKRRERARALAAVRVENAFERLRRLRPGWDWRKGGRAARDAARC